MSKRRIVLFALIGAVAALWLGNTSAFHAPPSDAGPKLIAHRGVHQVFVGTRAVDGCKAAQIAAPQHSYIENTLPSMRAAFDAGADVVEIDVHLTPDGVFAVFHDWTLDCQTDGSGVTEETPWPVLKTLDIGYGFTAPDGSYPLRGKGRGMMPRLEDVLALPGDTPAFLINFKSNRAEEGQALATFLHADAARARIWGVYGGARPTRAALEGVQGLKGLDRPNLRACITRYAALGWSGHVPPSCRDSILMIPINVAPWLWGWPHRFTARMKAAGAEVILVGPYGADGFISGIDDAQMLARVPRPFDGFLWTDRIELLGPMLVQR